ncbi:DUF1858 domain-containing protein [Heliomicrobium gestii]|nr:DUF1858 domain-containing protein [Heliomicrobium gestii]MBM7867024.1 hybrid cluster-associated redox disulfide protein [Heliomicrobium gestii]
MGKITKDMSLMALLQEYPEAGEILARHGMGCLGCMGSATETIEGGARMHDINLRVLLAELQRLEKQGPA